MRQVVFRRYGQVQFMLHVPHDTDNFHPGRSIQRTIEANAFADRVGAGPMLSRECFIDNDHRRRAGLVLFGKAAAFKDRNSHRLKIIRRADAITPIVLLPGRWFWSALNQVGVR